MHLLLTNDDGLDAAGLAALEVAARGLPGVEISVVAPISEQSQCGHRVTTREPLIVEARDPRRWAVRGTPADCVRVALFGLGLRPDVVLSGINHGGNMGQDLVISGTVAAAREAAYHGLPAMALSHYLIRDLPLEWARVSVWVRELLERLLSQPADGGRFLNINLPHLPAGDLPLPEVIRCFPARAPLKVEFARSDPQGSPEVTEFFYTASYAERPADPGSDVEVCFGGRVAVSEVGV